MMRWIKYLQQRWQINSLRQTFVILLVFSVTGMTIVFAKEYIIRLFYKEGEDVPVRITVLYYLLMPFIYNILLLFYGFVFGEFTFFLNFEKRFFRRIFRRKKDS